MQAQAIDARASRAETHNAAVIARRPDPAASSVWRGLGQQVSGHVMAVSALQQKAPGDLLFAEGDSADSVYEVVRGTVRLSKLLPDGRRLVTGFLTSGHLLGLAPGGVRVDTAEAITEVTLCRYNRAAFDRLIDEVPGFARRLLAVTTQELGAAQERMLLLGRKSAAEKVASFLLALVEQRNGAEDDTVDVPMTRADIADYLGLTIETVSRTLGKLKQDGLIALPSTSRVEILDRDMLEELAAGDMGSDI